MKELLKKIAINVKQSFDQDETVVPHTGRIRSRLIFQALRSIRELLEGHFGGNIKCRFPGYRDEDKLYCSDPTPYHVIEYLLDFSFSRYSIPQAIGDIRAEPIYEGKYELLFGAESELGTSTEVCRDLLKLLDTRAVIRCLLFRKRSGANANKLNDRLLNVFQNHVHSEENRDGWLFIPMEINGGKVHCTFFTFTDDFESLIQIH